LKEATKALRELRMFQQMRAKSMKVCRETIEETKEAEKLAKAEGAKDEPVDEPEPQEAPAEFFEADESEEPVTVPETATPEELHDQKSS
jgi:hypothetical protein